MSTAADKAALAEGAEAIKKARKASTKPAKEPKAKKTKGKNPEGSNGNAEGKEPEPPIEAIEPSEKPAQKLVQQYLEFSENKMGVTLSPKTPLPAFLTMFDDAGHINRASGFILGDMIIQARELYGNKFDAIMAASGRPIGTLKVYEDTARSVPADQRKPWLDFTKAREIARLKDVTVQAELIQKIETAIDKGEITSPTVAQIRQESRSLKPAKPRPRKEARTPKAKKPKKGATVEPPADYIPSPDEELLITEFTEALDKLSGLTDNTLLEPLLLKMPNRDKEVWNKASKPVRRLLQIIEDKTGYAH